jgi:hypothetical protein
MDFVKKIRVNIKGSHIEYPLNSQVAFGWLALFGYVVLPVVFEIAFSFS